MKIKFIKNCFLTVVSISLLTSCNIEDDSTAVIPTVPTGIVENPVTISQLIIANPELSLLEQALRRVESETDTKIITTLNVPGGSTIFAPNNDAFTNFLESNGIASIDDLDVNELSNLMQNHVVTSEFTSANLQSGYLQTFLVNDDSDINVNMYVSTTEGVVLNGGPSVVEADIEANNGVIHIISGVINIPTIATFTGQDPNLSGFHSTVIDLGIRPIIGQIAQRTVFVPNNAAFNAFAATLDLPEAGQEIDSLVRVNLVNTLNNHVVVDLLSTPEMARLTTTRVGNPFTEDTIAGEELEFNVTTAADGVDEAGDPIIVFDSVVITDALGNNVSLDEQFSDITASNGTMHIINAVLQLPEVTE